MILCTLPYLYIPNNIQIFTWEVYVLIDPRNNVVRYIGCAQCARERLNGHLHGQNVVDNRKLKWVLQLKQEGLRPKMAILLSTFDKNYALNEEARMMAFYKDNDLLNIRRPIFIEYKESSL